jgi:hypothetical protein
MPVTINRIESLRRIVVTGDPSTYTNVPCSLVPGDVVYREDGATSYLMTDAGLVAGTSLDESPVFTSMTFSTKVVSTTALATPSALAATAFNAFASTVSGATLMGFGTTGDVTLKNRAGTDVVIVLANTTNVRIAGTLTTGGTGVAVGTAIANASSVGMTNGSNVADTADGVIALYNAAQTGFTRLLFGGTDTNFPAIKRSSATLAFRLADDSADAAITCAGITASGKVQCPASSTARASLNLGNAGTAPTAPADGDMWIESNTIKVRLNGATVTVTTS